MTLLTVTLIEPDQTLTQLIIDSDGHWTVTQLWLDEPNPIGVSQDPIVIIEPMTQAIEENEAQPSWANDQTIIEPRLTDSWPDWRPRTTQLLMTVTDRTDQASEKADDGRPMTDYYWR